MTSAPYFFVFVDAFSGRLMISSSKLFMFGFFAAIFANNGSKTPCRGEEIAGCLVAAYYSSPSFLFDSPFPRSPR